MHVYVLVFVCVCLCVGLFVCVCGLHLPCPVHVHMPVCECACMGLCLYVCDLHMPCPVHIHMPVCECACMGLCLCLFVCVCVCVRLLFVCACVCCVHVRACMSKVWRFVCQVQLIEKCRQKAASQIIWFCQLMLYDSCQSCHKWSSIVNSGLTSCQCFLSYWGSVSGLCFFSGLRSAWGTKISPEVFELFPSERERRVGRVLAFSHVSNSRQKTLNSKIGSRNG